VTFAEAKSVEKVLANGPHELDGKKVDPKIAFPKRANPKVSSGGRRAGAHRSLMGAAGVRRRRASPLTNDQSIGDGGGQTTARRIIKFEYEQRRRRRSMMGCDLRRRTDLAPPAGDFFSNAASSQRRAREGGGALTAQRALRARPQSAGTKWAGQRLAAPDRCERGLAKRGRRVRRPLAEPAPASWAVRVTTGELYLCIARRRRRWAAWPLPPSRVAAGRRGGARLAGRPRAPRAPLRRFRMPFIH
jgi:hypothetical protein